MVQLKVRKEQLKNDRYIHDQLINLVTKLLGRLNARCEFVTLPVTDMVLVIVEVPTSFLCAALAS